MSVWTSFSEEMEEKRVLEVPTPAAKRMKMGDSKPAPVEQKIEMIEKALSTKEFEVPGPESNRKMLLAMAPSILGTPHEDRHASQHEMAKMLRIVFEEEEARLQLRVAEQQAKLDGADSEKAEHEAAKKEEERKLDAKKEEIKSLKLALAKLVETTTDTDFNLHTAMREQAKVGKEREALTAEKGMYTEAQQNSFNVLKDGSEDAADQKQHFAAIKKVLNKLKADPSLLMALSKTLAKPPAQRGDFDEVVVQEITMMFDDHLASLEKKLADIVEGMAPLEKDVEVAQEAAAEAKRVQLEQAEAALGLLAQRKALEEAVCLATARVEEHQPRMATLTQEHKKEEVGLHFYQKEVLGSLNYLSEWRVGGATPPAAE